MLKTEPTWDITNQTLVKRGGCNNDAWLGQMLKAMRVIKQTSTITVLVCFDATTTNTYIYIHYTVYIYIYSYIIYWWTMNTHILKWSGPILHRISTFYSVFKWFSELLHLHASTLKFTVQSCCQLTPSPLLSQDPKTPRIHTSSHCQWPMMMPTQMPLQKSLKGRLDSHTMRSTSWGFLRSNYWEPFAN